MYGRVQLLRRLGAPYIFGEGGGRGLVLGWFLDFVPGCV
jgi:hypothetical protein